MNEIAESLKRAEQLIERAETIKSAYRDGYNEALRTVLSILDNHDDTVITPHIERLFTEEPI